MRGARSQQHGMCEASALAEPFIRIRGQLRDGIILEEFGRGARRGGFFPNRFGSVFAELGNRAMFVRLRPGAAWTIETAGLIHL